MHIFTFTQGAIFLPLCSAGYRLLSLLLAGSFMLLISATAQAQGIASITRVDQNSATFRAGNIAGDIKIDTRSNTTAASGFNSGAVTGGTNFPGSWYSPALTPGNFTSIEIDNQVTGAASFRMIISFDRAITNPVLHFGNIDSAYYDLANTRQVNGTAAALTKVSGNAALAVSATRINTTTTAAQNAGCQANDGTNPPGRCGSVRVNGVYSQLIITVTETYTPTQFGDGHALALSIPTQYDFGDAPASYGTARHPIGVIFTNPYMGAAIDYELADQPSATANGDDIGGLNDDDGVTINQLFLGRPGFIDIVARNTGYLQAWIDWNGDGDFYDSGEQIARDVTDNSVTDLDSAIGKIRLAITPPANAVITPTFARFRYAIDTALSPNTAASDGETEDYQITLIDANLTISKSSNVVTNAVEANNPKAIPGAHIRYCMVITNAGSAVSTNIQATDSIPTQLSFVPGSMRSGATCDNATTVEDDDGSGPDEDDPVGMSYANGTVTITHNGLAAGSSFAATFEVTLQ